MSLPSTDVRRRHSLPTRIRKSSHTLQRMSHQMKLNPYVGWFRHSPDTSSVPSNWKKHPHGLHRHYCSSSHSAPMVMSSFERRTSPFHVSPYVGYFRHSPITAMLFKAMEDELSALFKAFLPNFKVSCVQELADFLAGRLRGGSPSWYGSDNNKMEDHIHSSALLNARVLTRIVGWILAPFLGDTSISFKSLQNPHELHASTTTDTERANFHFSDRTNVEGQNDDDSDCDSEHDLEDPPLTTRTSVKSSSTVSDGISNQAEAYFAHQAANELNPDEAIPSRLDFVITQMDIIRMQRTASRHLDVQSIYQLPTVTYLKHNNKNSNNNDKSIEEHHGEDSACNNRELSDEANNTEEGWSWMLVTEQDQSIPTNNQDLCSARNEDMDGGGEDDDVCVICLERFVYGDRLRVLPCGHSFHMGCIDRWLSGSASFDECHTAGCPTCKKRPTLKTEQVPEAQGFYNNEEEEIEGELRSDGSVPSWAFTQLGSALLARDSQQLISNASS